jgi:hypothetical protein
LFHDDRQAARVDCGWTEDDKRIRFVMRAGEGRAFIERDVASEPKRKCLAFLRCVRALLRNPPTGGSSHASLAIRLPDAASRSCPCRWKVLAASEGEALSGFMWTADSRAVLAHLIAEMRGGEFDELRFFEAIQNSHARALLIGRRALVLIGLPVLTADYDFWIAIDDIAAFNGGSGF